jgi:N-acetylglucosamine repressor
VNKQSGEALMQKSNQEITKAHNQQLALSLIYSQGAVSRAELARQTGLTRSTISEIVSELIEEGLVVEVGRAQSSGGKPPILIDVNPDARHIIGIDLASSEFRGAIINLRGEIKERTFLPIDDQSGDEALALVYELIDRLLTLTDAPILGIGIGTPGLMDVDRGVVLTAVNLDWQDLHLADLLQAKYNLPVSIANDSQVSALAEYSFGDHAPVTNLVLVKVGRGVGAGIVKNKELYSGDGFGAGEIGHVKIDDQGELCSCGNRGCLETKISSRAIQKMVLERSQNSQDSELSQKIHSQETINLEDILSAYQSGETFVVDIIKDVGRDLAQALAFLVGILNIQCIVIAGSVSDFGAGLVSEIEKYLQGRVLTLLSQDTQVNISSLGEDIVMLGAAALILQNQLGIK